MTLTQFETENSVSVSHEERDWHETSIFVWYAGSLAALVYQHTITPLALPCKLILPEVGWYFYDRPLLLFSTVEGSINAPRIK